ncbi:MAG: serine/threonine-protein kinase [Streptosporangiaceae bacterium]
MRSSQDRTGDTEPSSSSALGHARSGGGVDDVGPSAGAIGVTRGDPIPQARSAPGPQSFLRPERYEIQRLVRSAPAKTVYLARDRQLGCQVVLDVFSSTTEGLTASAWETKVLGQLGDHRSIAQVLDRWEVDGTAVMAIRYLAGGSLRDLLDRSQESGEQLPVDRVLRIATELASSLEHIHSHRFLHRDLQPRNVLFDEWGAVHLVDFDTAISLDDRQLSDLPHGPVYEYMAPELIDGQPADERADLYALGAIIYEMCQGRPPFSRDDTTAGRADGPPVIDREDLPDGLHELVRCLLALDQDHRPASATGAIALLESIRAGQEPQGAAFAAPRADSQSLPEPDPAEVRASRGARAADYQVGDFIDDRFEILDVLGRGGFSKVYRVRDDVEGEERAFKLFDSAAGYAAVRREIGALRKIRHRNVVEVFWADKTAAGDWYLVTEFINGETLEEYATGNKILRDREAADVAIDLLGALVAFHPDVTRLSELDAARHEREMTEAELSEWMELKEKGLVHRDIKPLNVMLTRSGVKLLDFNIASRVGDPVKTVSGTPPYQPPDADLTRWDVSTDLFAVGVLLYQLLCNGQHPYPNAMPMIDEPVIDPRTVRPDLKPELAEFLVKACASTRVDRYSTADEMQLALRETRSDL